MDYASRFANFINISHPGPDITPEQSEQLRIETEETFRHVIHGGQHNGTYYTENESFAANILLFTDFSAILLLEDGYKMILSPEELNWMLRSGQFRPTQHKKEQDHV